MTREPKVFTRAVFIFRMSAIGDLIIAARTVGNFVQNGYFPIFVSALFLKDILLKIKYLRAFICFDENFVSHYYVDGNEVSIDIFNSELQVPGFQFEPVFCDLQQTSRSRKARKKIARTLFKNKKIIVYKVKKRSFYRFFLVLRSFFSFGQKKRKTSILNFERVHETQLAVVNKIFSRDGKENVCLNRETYLKHDENILNEKYICIFPGAQHFTKRWPKEHVETFINLILKKTDYIIYICGGAHEEDLQFSDALMFSPRVRNKIGKHSLKDVLHLISYATYVVSNDSFASHTADAYHIPATIIFGGTTPQFGFVPLSPRIKIKYLNLTCSPCSRHGRSSCRFRNLRCLTDIHPIEIFKDFDLIQTD